MEQTFAINIFEFADNFYHHRWILEKKNELLRKSGCHQSSVKMSLSVAPCIAVCVIYIFFTMEKPKGLGRLESQLEFFQLINFTMTEQEPQKQEKAERRRGGVLFDFHVFSLCPQSQFLNVKYIANAVLLRYAFLLHVSHHNLQLSLVICKLIETTGFCLFCTKQVCHFILILFTTNHFC